MRALFDIPHSAVSPRIIAHRGASALEPENSIPAFERAGRFGVWAIETDVYKTRDGRLVCFHNKQVDGCTNGSGLLAELTFDEIQKLYITAGNNIESYTIENLRIPTFEEYLSICRRYGSIPFIELKMPIAEEVMSVVREYGLEEHCVFSTSNLELLAFVRTLSKKVFIHLIFGKEKDIDTLCRLGYSGMSYKISNLDDVPDGLVEHTHSFGLRVCFRAADTPELVRRAIEMGCDYVPSNRVMTLNLEN